MLINSNFIIILYLNCHQLEIKRYLYHIMPEYKIYVLSTYENILNGNIFEEAIKNYYENIEKADIIIYNPIKEIHDKWNYKNILNINKNNCYTVKIPYSRCSIYNVCNTYYDITTLRGVKNKLFKFNLLYEPVLLFLNQYGEPNNDNIKYFYDIMKNTKIDIDWNAKINNDLYKFKILTTENSDIDMYDYVYQNYKNEKLFLNYDHPNTNYFRFLTIKISEFLLSNNKNFKFNIDNVPYYNNNLVGNNEIPLVDDLIINLYLNFYDNDIQLHNTKISKNDFYKIFMFLSFNDSYKNKYVIDDNITDDVVNTIINDILFF